MSNLDLSRRVVDQLRRTPIHDVLLELGRSAVAYGLVETPEFQKLVAYLLELADGRDRREPWHQKPGIARPVPRLRVVMESGFGQYSDLQWFRLNKTANGSGRPLVGLFPRMAASVARIDSERFGQLVRALVADSPDAAVLQLLHASGGKVPGAGLELFSRLAYAFRPDLYFVIPRSWGESSGCLKFIGTDQRKYCAVCRKLRDLCDEVEIEPAVRASVFHHALDRADPPGALVAVLNRAIGPTLARFTVLGPSEAYEPETGNDHCAAMPLDFAARAIRARRGPKMIRTMLLKSFGDRCTISGDCPRELLEVGYLVPFPKGELHSLGNTLLLRSDLHTLWDLNLVGVDPVTMTVKVAERLAGTVYAELEGRPVAEGVDGTKINATALRERWTTFGSDRFAEKLARPESRRKRTPAAGSGAPEIEVDRRVPDVDEPRVSARPAEAEPAPDRVN